MHLQTDEAFLMIFVDFLVKQIGNLPAVNPSLDARSLSENAIVVPLARSKGFMRNQIFRWW